MPLKNGPAEQKDNVVVSVKVTKTLSHVTTTISLFTHTHNDDIFSFEILVIHLSMHTLAKKKKNYTNGPYVKGIKSTLQL